MVLELCENDLQRGGWEEEEGDEVIFCPALGKFQFYFIYFNFFHFIFIYFRGSGVV